MRFQFSQPGDEVQGIFAEQAAVLRAQNFSFLSLLLGQALRVPVGGALVADALDCGRVFFKARKVAVKPVKFGPLPRHGVFLPGLFVVLRDGVEVGPSPVEPFQVPDGQDTVAQDARLTLRAAAGIKTDRKGAGTGGVSIHDRLPPALALTETGVIEHRTAGAFPAVPRGGMGFFRAYRCQTHFRVAGFAAVVPEVVHFAAFVQVGKDMPRRQCFFHGQRPAATQPGLRDLAKLLPDDLEALRDFAAEK